MEVWTSDNHAVGAGFSVDLDRWQDEFDKLMLRIGSRFARVDRGGGRRPSSGPAGGAAAGRLLVDRRARRGRRPAGMQRLLSAAIWDGTRGRDDLRGHLLEHFADPAAVGVAERRGPEEGT